MLRPHGVRNKWLLGVLAGVGGLLGAWHLWDSEAYGVLPPCLLMVSLMTLPIFGIFVLLYGTDALRWNRMVSGKDLLARWRVDRDQWYRFCHLNNALNAQGDRPYCRLPTTGQPRPDGVEVFVGKTSVMVDGNFYHLPRVVVKIEGLWWHEGPPAFIEFHCVTEDDSGPSAWTLRIPAAAGEERKALEAIEYYRKDRPIKTVEKRGVR